MSTPCAICGHPRRAMIERSIRSGAPINIAATHFRVPAAALATHTQAGHATPAPTLTRRERSILNKRAWWTPQLPNLEKLAAKTDAALARAYAHAGRDLPTQGERPSPGDVTDSGVEL